MHHPRVGSVLHVEAVFWFPMWNHAVHSFIMLHGMDDVGESMNGFPSLFIQLPQSWLLNWIVYSKSKPFKAFRLWPLVPLFKYCNLSYLNWCICYNIVFFFIFANKFASFSNIAIFFPLTSTFHTLFLSTFYLGSIYLNITSNQLLYYLNYLITTAAVTSTLTSFSKKFLSRNLLL